MSEGRLAKNFEYYYAHTQSNNNREIKKSSPLADIHRI